MNVAVVMPVGPGRLENVLAVLASLKVQSRLPNQLVLVEDGPDVGLRNLELDSRVQRLLCAKHEPGMEQPRNVGARWASYLGATHLWFLDSDVVVSPFALEELELALEQGPEDRILVAPYDWAGPGVREYVPRGDPRIEMADPRWPSFDTYGPPDVLHYDLGAALACFSGNLLWPVEQFERVGGFHPMLHHGRCEDGELGLRASSLGVGVSFVASARGMHLWHAINHALATERNSRDVPLLNAWHPWVQEQGVIVKEADGARFEWKCPRCGNDVNTLDGWAHVETCA